jgi:hypothetical protein
MEWDATWEDPLMRYLEPFRGLIGDKRTWKTFGETVKGIIGAGSLICQRIAAQSAELSKGKKGSQRVIRLATGQSTQRSELDAEQVTKQLREVAVEHPRTVILSTHLIDEISRLLEHILVIDQGRLVLDEETEALRGRAFAVVGPAARVDTYTAGKELLARSPLGGLVSATIMGNGDASDRKQAEALGLSLVPVSLQQLIVHLTSEPSERKAVEVR